MLDLKLLYLLYLTFFWIVSVLLTLHPKQTIAHIQETLNDPERTLYLGLTNVAFGVVTLYTSFYFFPNLSPAEIVMSAVGVFVGVKGFYHIFWPKKIAEAIKGLYQTKLELFRNTIIITALILLYFLITI